MEIEICKEFIVPFTKAIIAAEKFFSTNALPQSIKWVEY